MNDPFYKKFIRFAYAMMIWIMDGFRIPSKKELNERKSICLGNSVMKKCDRWNQKAYFGIGCCSECGCCKLKLYIRTSTCPLSKW